MHTVAAFRYRNTFAPLHLREKAAVINGKKQLKVANGVSAFLSSLFIGQIEW